MNKARPEVTINLDKPRILRLDLNAMCEFEQVIGRSLFDGSFSGAGMSAIDMRAMLWACLLGDDPELTLEQVGSLISIDNMTEVASKLNEAFEVAVPKARRKSDRPLPTSTIG